MKIKLLPKKALLTEAKKILKEESDFILQLKQLKDEPKSQWINRLECAYRKVDNELLKAKSPHENVIYVEFKNKRIKV